MRVMQELDLTRAMNAVKPRVESFLRPDGVAPRLIAFGKAARPMTEWFLDTFELATVEGVHSAPDVAQGTWRGLECFRGGHPVPNKASLNAAAAALRTVRTATEHDRVVFLVSGGGSALFELPCHPSVGLRDLRSLNAVLVSCGADIVEVNVIRKHLSAVKGGRLAEAAFPAKQLTLYVSDVPAGQDASVASGPTMPDESTAGELRRIVAKYELGPRLPEAVISRIHDPDLGETPKPGASCFGGSQWICVLENRHAIVAAQHFAEEQDWRTVVDVTVDDTEVAGAAEHLLDRLHRMRASAGDRPACVISGGELSSPVLGDGVGGRNQAFVLECARRIAGEPITVLSAGTDGIDGNSPAAGGVADGTTLERAASLRMDAGDYGGRSDSYSFFKRLGDDVTCGATGNNVRDIRVLVYWP